MSKDTGEWGRRRFINIRKLAALDIAFHGSRVILVEFLLTAICLFAFGAFLVVGQVHSRAPSWDVVAFGTYLLLLGLNYVPLSIYGAKIARGQSAASEVEYELAHRERYARKYGLQSLLLFVPLVVPVLAIHQETARA